MGDDQVTRELKSGPTVSAEHGPVRDEGLQDFEDNLDAYIDEAFRRTESIAKAEREAQFLSSELLNFRLKTV